MRLKACYIMNFGKLTDYKIAFDRRTTVINQNNGFGKTTLCAFIKAMFYGFNNTKSQDLNENERLKYYPWQGGVYGGVLEFSCDKGEYRIERRFGQKASADEFNLYNLKTGDKCTDFSERIGEELFGIDIKGFERCTMFKSESSNGKMPISIFSRLLGLDSDADGFNAYEKAIDKLQKRMRQYATTGNRGILYDLQREISALQDDISETKQAELELAQLVSNKELLAFEKQTKLNELENVRNLISENATIDVIKQKVKHYNSLVAKCKSLQAEYQQLEQKYDEKLPENNELSECTKLCEKIEFLEEEAQKHKKLKPSVIAFSVVMFVLSIGVLLAYLLSVKSIFMLVGVAVLVVIPIVSLISAMNNRKIRLKSITVRITEAEQKINEFLSKYNIKSENYIQALEDVKKDLEEYKNLKNLYNDAYNEAKKYYKDENMKSVRQDIEENAPKDLKEKEKRLIFDVDDISSKILRQENDEEALREKVSHLEKLEFSLKQTNENREKADENYKVLQTAIKLLELSKQNLSLKYKEKIEKSFKEYVKFFYNDDFDEMVISEDFQLSAINKGFSRKIDSYSSGIKSVIELSLRLALLETLFEKEAGFIILDDPFVHLDDNAFSLVSEKLKALSEKSQIIYLTCTNSRIINK